MPRKTKVLVNGHDLKFWNPIQAQLDKLDIFEFRQDIWSGHDTHDEDNSLACLQWADVIFSEWTLGNAVWYSKHKAAHQKHITRLHLQERGTEYPARLKLENVDQIAFVGAHIQQEVVERFSIPSEKTCVVPNFVDFEKYALPKKSGAEYNLGIIGIVPLRKRMDLAVDLLENLLEKDHRYTLHIKGAVPQSYRWLWARTAEREYYEALWSRIRQSTNGNRVIFHPPGDDIAEWFQNIGYILSPSNFESFHMAIAEGLCSGTIPVIWDWQGASDIYPFILPVRDQNDAANFIHQTATNATFNRIQEQSSTYVKDNFDTQIVCKRWAELLSITHTTRTGQDAADETQGCDHVLVIWLVVDWADFHRKEMLEALAKHLAKESIEMLVVEPGDSADHLVSSGRETPQNLQSYTNKQPIKIGPNIHKVRITTAQLAKKLGHALRIKKLERWMAGARLAEIVQAFYGYESSVLHWIFKPNQVERLAHGADDQFIYEVYDDYSYDFGTGSDLPDMLSLEQRTSAKAQHVFFTADILAERKAAHCSNFSVISNGVNFPIFDYYRVTSTNDASDGRRATVGYLGNLSDFFDWELVLEVCSTLADVDFYFHGGIEADRLTDQWDTVQKTIDLPNTMFTGRISRQQGAAALARYDALIIPFLKNDAMDAVNPLKLWEYFALGKAVISSPMKATAHLQEEVAFASDATDWIKKIRSSLLSPPNSQQETHLVDLARSMSWSNLTSGHASIVSSLFASNTCKQSRGHQKK